MSDVTPLFGFPYPEQSDPVAAGATAMQFLAEALDDFHNVNAWLQRTALLSVATGVATDVVWHPAGSAMSGEFALSAGDTVLTYTGPTRWFVYDVKAFWPVTSDVGGAAVRNATLMLNGTTWQFDNVDLSYTMGGRGNRYAGLVPLATGYTLTLNVSHIAGAARDVSPILTIVGL